MSAGKVIGYIVAAIFILFGVLFIWGAFSSAGGGVTWIVIGVVTVAVGLGIIALIKFRQPKPPQEIIQKIDLSGDMSMEKIKCKNCGADLDKNSITVREGAIFVSCPYCGSTYQMVEEPKW